MTKPVFPHDFLLAMQNTDKPVWELWSFNRMDAKRPLDISLILFFYVDIHRIQGIPYIGNHSWKKIFANSLWLSHSQENVRDLSYWKNSEKRAHTHNRLLSTNWALTSFQLRLKIRAICVMRRHGYFAVSHANLCLLSNKTDIPGICFFQLTSINVDA